MCRLREGHRCPKKPYQASTQVQPQALGAKRRRFADTDPPASRVSAVASFMSSGADLLPANPSPVGGGERVVTVRRCNREQHHHLNRSLLTYFSLAGIALRRPHAERWDGGCGESVMVSLPSRLSAHRIR